VFHANGESKAAARHNVAQAALNVLGPKINAELERRKAEKQEKTEAKKADVAQAALNVLGPKINAELERRKAEKQEKTEAKKAERTELLEKAKMQEDKGEEGNVNVKTESSDTVSDGNTSEDKEQKPQTDEGTGADQETKPRVQLISALRVLKDIRPGISCVERVIPNAPAGHHGARVVVDGHTFEGSAQSVSQAKALAAASALTSLFNLSFEYSPRKNFTMTISFFIEHSRRLIKE